MYIKSVELKGFQSHLDTLLEFVKGVNIITGSSNSGKTAILRDLNWIFNDRPLGISFINNDSSQVTTIMIVVDDDGMYHKIMKVKDKKKLNTYYVWKNIYGRDLVGVKPDMEFTAFKGEVPLEIRRLLNMGEVNIQEQLSPYFLVLDSPGQVAQYIRSVAGLNDIDKVIEEISSRIRSTTKEVGTLEESLKAKEKELGNYERLGLEDLESYIESCKQLESMAENLTLQISLLKSFIREYDECEEVLRKFEKVDLNLLENYIQYTRDALQDANDLEVTISGLETTIREIKSNSRFDKVGDFENLLTEADVVHQSWSGVAGEVITLSELIQDIKEVSKFDGIECDEVLETATVLLDTNVRLMDEASVLLETIEGLDSIKSEQKMISERIRDCTVVETELLKQLSNCPYCGELLSDEGRKMLLGEGK